MLKALVPLLIGLMTIPSVIFGYEFEASGIGGGGWLHSGAFHPTNPQMIIVGTDMAGGIYRTDNFGDSWHPDNTGLQNNDEKDSNYVEDILGFSSSDGQFTGFIAATYGGIYFKNGTSGPFECKTPMSMYGYSTQSASTYNTDPENFIARETLIAPQFPIPYSCLTSVGDVIYAGAGRVRWNTKYETSYYPGLADSVYADSSPGGQYTVWKYDFSGTQTWEKFSTDVTFGSARDISGAEINGQTYLAVATPGSIQLFNGSTWTDMSALELEFEGSTFSSYYPDSLTCWSLHLTSRGTLYTAMRSEGKEVPSGVFRIFDVTAPNPRWVWVGDGSPASDGGLSVREAGADGKNLIYLTVRDGEGSDPDVLYLGSRSGHYGLYKGRQPYVSTAETGTWEQVVYTKNENGTYPMYDHNGGLIDHGWNRGSAAVLFHPTLAPSDTNRLLIQLNTGLYVSDDAGETWRQTYCEGSDAGGWKTKGYNEFVIQGLVVDGDNRLLMSTGDSGLFRTTDAGWKYGAGYFENLNPAVNCSTTAESVEIWNPESHHIKVLPDWNNSGKEAVVVHFGDMIQKHQAGKIMMLHDGAWSNITANVPNLRYYLFPDFEFISDDTMFAIYLEYTDTIGVDGSYFRECGILRFDYDGANWNPVVVNDGLLGSDGVSQIYGSDLLYHHPSRKLFLSTMHANFSKQPEAAPVHTIFSGSLYSLDLAGGDGAGWVQQLALGDTSSFHDVRCMALSSDGAVLYIGTRGRSAAGDGTVLRSENPGDAQIDVVPLVNMDTGMNFGFTSPVSESWSPEVANNRLTDVRAIVVDPANQYHIFVGLHADGFANQEGAWEFDGTSWTHLSEGQLFEGMGISSLFYGGEPYALIIGTGGQGLYYYQMPYSGPQGPDISNAAEYPILANNADPTTAIAVKVTHPAGYHNMEVFVDATGLGGSTALARDDGSFPDMKSGDDIYTAPLDSINVPPGTHNIVVHAVATTSTGGDGSYAENNAVQVEAIDSAVKMSKGSNYTGELKSQLVGNPYAENYFSSTLLGVNEWVLSAVEQGNSYAPQTFRKKPLDNKGTPDFEEKTNIYYDVVPPGGARAFVQADVDGAPGQEIFVCNNGSSPRFYRNVSGPHPFVDETSAFFDAAGMEAIKYSHTAAWGDYNSDGFIDLAVATLDQSRAGYTLADFDSDPAAYTTISLFRGFGDHFELTSHSAFPSDMTVLSMSWRDINNDNLEDLVLFGFNPYATNPIVMINNGYDVNIEDYTLTQSTAWGLNTSVRCFAWTDFDHDDAHAQDLIILSNDKPGNKLALLRVDPAGGYVDTTSTDLGGVFETVLVGDVLQNGQQDIAVFPSRGWPVYYGLYYYDGSGFPVLINKALTYGLKSSTLAVGQYASGGVIADFNDDHDLDLLVGWPANQEFFFRNVRSSFDENADYVGTGQYINDIPIVGEQNWVDVQLTSLGGVNRSCIGTKVLVKEDSGARRQWIQIVDGGSGRGQQDPNQLHFGLGSYSGTVSVLAFWPLADGSFSAVGLEEVNQVIQIGENANKSGPCIAIIPGSERFSYKAFPGGADWIFEWQTDVKGDLTKDYVTWGYQAGQFVGQSCLGSYPGVLHQGDPDVELSVYYADGNWQHRLVWKNQICSTSPCPFEFEVTSGYDGCSVTGSTTQFGRFKVCIGQ